MEEIRDVCLNVVKSVARFQGQTLVLGIHSVEPLAQQNLTIVAHTLTLGTS